MYLHLIDRLPRGLKTLLNNMTQEEILEGNELIAKFIGRNKSYDERDRIYHYDTSWDWLMPVVEKIESLGWDIEIIKNSCAIRCGNKPNRFFETLTICDLKMEAVWSSIVKFIKWYNQQVKP